MDEIINTSIENLNIENKDDTKKLKTAIYTLNAVKKYRLKNASKVLEYSKEYNKKKKEEKKKINPYIDFTKKELFDKLFELENKIKELENSKIDVNKLEESNELKPNELESNVLKPNELETNVKENKQKKKIIILKKTIKIPDIIIPETIISKNINVPELKINIDIPLVKKPTKKYPQLSCIHNKYKRYCKICTPNAFCIHLKKKENCRLCRGKNICIHSKRKSQCAICGGTELCCHKRIKSNCNECGTNKCIHNNNKGYCIECNKHLFCVHKRKTNFCKDCNGKFLCPHKMLKSICKNCNGNRLCLHKRIKLVCIKCNTKLICPHGKNIKFCVDCGSKKYCLHKKWKQLCKQCGGSALCKSSWCENSSNKKYNGYCMFCCIQLCPDIKISRNYKTKENTVVTSIKEAFPKFTWVCDKKVEDGCSRRRPDLLLDMGTHIIIVEVDENKHTDYDCSCENKRLMEISKDVGHRSIVFIRFNPDGYKDKDGKTIKSCWICTKQGAMVIVKTKQAEWDERLKSLKTQIQYWIDNKTEKTIEIVELFY